MQFARKDTAAAQDTARKIGKQRERRRKREGGAKWDTPEFLIFRYRPSALLRNIISRSFRAALKLLRKTAVLRRAGTTLSSGGPKLVFQRRILETLVEA